MTRSAYSGSVVIAGAVAAALWVFPARTATLYPETPTPNRSAQRAQTASVPTPRTPDGHPDLSGRWGGGGGGGASAGTIRAVDAQGKTVEFKNAAEAQAAGATKIFARNYAPRHGNPTYAERDAGMRQRLFVNPPLYKPEFWDKVQYLDVNGNYEDSNFKCMPAGVPRMGPPIKIVQAATEVILLYGEKNTWRVVPTDGRPHDAVNSKDQTYLGDSVARWDGETLVVDVVGFNEDTWLGWPGWFHTNEMRVEERFRREGNTLHYQATVYDPTVLMETWKMEPRTLQLNSGSRPYTEDPPCVPDERPMVSRERG